MLYLFWRRQNRINLPLTIISRCQRFDFKPITPSDIMERMKTVLADTGIESDEGTLKVIAQAASGGMRDALSMLDQVVSFSGDKLTVEDALACHWVNWRRYFLSIGRGTYLTKMLARHFLC